MATTLRRVDCILRLAMNLATDQGFPEGIPKMRGKNGSVPACIVLRVSLYNEAQRHIGSGRYQAL